MSGIVKKGSEDFLYLYPRNIILLYAREDYTSTVMYLRGYMFKAETTCARILLTSDCLYPAVHNTNTLITNNLIVHTFCGAVGYHGA